jgi:capsid protein
LFTSITPSEFRRNERTYQRFDAIGNGRDLLDPFKEGEARTTRLRTCMSTFKEECARNGKHWIRVLMQKAIEVKVSELFGVTLDFSKTGGGGSGSEQNEESGQDEESDQQTEGAGRAA